MIISKTRSEWLEMLDAVSRAATVQRGESDDADCLKKFKYACGRNFDRIQSVLRKAQSEQDQITSSHPAFLEYTQKYSELGEQFCKRDENGQPVLDESDPEKPKYIFEKENQQPYRDAVDALRVEYRETLDLVESIWEQVEDIDLFMIPWAWVPERISGGYLFAISDMISDLPTELRVEEAE